MVRHSPGVSRCSIYISLFGITKMNERIKELVKQAGGHISIRNLASNPVQRIESVELWDDRIEKFAELIVRECCAITDEVERADLPVVASKFVKAHFGVE
jgi:hypothetical protein